MHIIKRWNASKILLDRMGSDMAQFFIIISWVQIWKEFTISQYFHVFLNSFGYRYNFYESVLQNGFSEVSVIKKNKTTFSTSIFSAHTENFQSTEMEIIKNENVHYFLRESIWVKGMVLLSVESHSRMEHFWKKVCEKSIS